MTDEVLEPIDIADWAGPFDAVLGAHARAALENGKVLFFPGLAFALLDDERKFLSASVANGKSKNISFDHATGAIQGTTLAGEDKTRLARMIDRFGTGATRLVEELIGYRGMQRARTSYRPAEIEGRAYSPTNDDRLLHVDAFPSRPMQGRRILRFFANVAPERPRTWNVGEPFESFARQFLPRARQAFPGQSWLFAQLGVTRGRRSVYDELMLSLHDTCKLDAHYQATSPHHALDFPPGTCWMVYTDQVLHAALGGAFALEQTFHFDIATMGEPATSPLRVLERMCRKALV